MLTFKLGCFNHSEIVMLPTTISGNILSSPNLVFCQNITSSSSIVAFNYYPANQTCQLFDNYTSTYIVNENKSSSQMCIRQLPDNQRADVMSCSISNSIWSSSGITVAGLHNELDSPFDVLFSADYSSMFVADAHHNQILQYNLRFNTYTIVYDGSDTGRPITGPLAMAMSNDGNNLIVGSYVDRRVLSWSMISNVSTQVSFSYIAGPTGLAVDQNGSVYVAESRSGAVYRFNWNMNVYEIDRQWRSLNAIGVKHITIVNNSLYAVLRSRCLVIKVSLADNAKTAIVVAGTGRLGSTADRLRFPWGIAVDPVEGHVFVSDMNNHRIQLWLVGAKAGITIAGITARSGMRSDQLNNPRGLTFGSDRSLFVADTTNNRIQKFQRYCLV